MSFFVFALIFAFILWQRLGKSRVPEKAVRPEAGRPAPPLAALTDDDKVEDIAADVAGLVSNFLGQNSRELIEQAVSRATQAPRSGTGRKSTEAVEPVARSVSSGRTAAPAREKQRAKYLLDGDGGYRQRVDRTARLQQSFGGRGLCSPRHAGPAKARPTNR